MSPDRLNRTTELSPRHRRRLPGVLKSALKKLQPGANLEPSHQETISPLGRPLSSCDPEIDKAVEAYKNPRPPISEADDK